MPARATPARSTAVADVDSVRPGAPRRPQSPSGAAGPVGRLLVGLQRTAGNAGVARALAGGGRAGTPGTPGTPPGLALLQRSAGPMVQRAPGPLVISAVTPSAAELGVGRRITAQVTATGSGSSGVTWALAGAPAGVTVHPRGRRAEIRSAAPVAGAPVGGASFTVSASAGGAAAVVSAPVLLVEVTGATFTPAPAFGGPFTTAIGTATAPPDTADPNRSGVTGNTATVAAVTAPAGRGVTVTARGGPGVGVAGLTLTPRAATGRQRLRVTDPATKTFLDTAMVVNSVPTRVSGFGAQVTGMPAFYGGWNTVLFAASDPSGAGTRPLAEIITVVRDDFGFGAPSGGAGTPSLPFSAPANNWTDQNGTPTTIDVNTFEGPGALGLPRLIHYRQQFFWMSWTGTFATAALPAGVHRRSLRRSGGGHVFRTEQIFGKAAATPMSDPYAGPPLIVLTGIAALPTAAGATALAADGTATASLVVTSTVGGRTVNWSVLSGGASAAITAGAAASPVGTPATVTATTRPGLVRVRATDTGFANRRGDGSFRVAEVRLGPGTAAPSPVPAGTLTATVTVPARPGGRTLTFAVDPAAAGAGVLVAAPTVTGIAHAAVVTRPASFTGVVTVTATDSVLAARVARVRVRFR